MRWHGSCTSLPQDSEVRVSYSTHWAMQSASVKQTTSPIKLQSEERHHLPSSKRSSVMRMLTLTQQMPTDQKYVAGMPILYILCTSAKETLVTSESAYLAIRANCKAQVV